MAASQRARSSMPSDFVRYAEPAEFDDVADLLLRANRDYRDLLPAPLYRAYRDDLCALVRDPAMLEQCEILVMGPSGAVTGCAAFFPDAGRQGLGWPRGWAGLRALAVDPDARGMGLGRRLVEAAIGRARAIGREAVGLHSAPFQAAARRLYRDLGFVRCPQYDVDAAGLPISASPADRLPLQAFTLRL